MTAEELRDRIKIIVPTILKSKKKSEEAAVEYDELTKFPELKAVIIDLLTDDFDNFLASIDWVAPKPTTFRINLKNDQNFYLIYTKNSWIAKVEGKKYYLLNLPEEQKACQAISRILTYGPPASMNGDEMESGGGMESGGEEVDVDVDITDEE